MKEMSLAQGMLMGIAFVFMLTVFLVSFSPSRAMLRPLLRVQLTEVCPPEEDLHMSNLCDFLRTLVEAP